MMSEYKYPPENKGMHPPGSYGYKLCEAGEELAKEIENLKNELIKALPKWLYKLLFWLA